MRAAATRALLAEIHVNLRRTSITALLLLAAAAVGAVAVTVATLVTTPVTEPPATEQPASPQSRTPRAETAPERLRRLWPAVAAGATPMREPATQPTIEQQLLRQTRHDGHVGLFTDRPAGYRPVAVVLHATGSGASGSEFPTTSALGHFFQRQGVAASHYGIGRDGTIMQYVDERHAAYHVSRPGWNGISIGIELLNDNTGSQPFPPAQLRAARALVTSLGERYRIPVEAVVAHRAIQPEDRSDPAANFPWEQFVASLASPTAASPSSRSAGSPDAGRRTAAGSTRLDLGQ